MCEGGCYTKGSVFSSSDNLKNTVLDNNINFKNSNRIAHLYSVFNSVGYCVMNFNIFRSHKFLNAQCFYIPLVFLTSYLRDSLSWFFCFLFLTFFFDSSEIFYGSK